MTLSGAPAVRSLMTRLVVFAAVGFGVTACQYSPLTAPSGSAITFSMPAQALTTDVVTVDVIVLESKSGPSTTTTTPTTPVTGGGNQTGNNNNNGTTTAGGGQPVHDGTLVVFSSTMGDLSDTEAHTRLGHATVTFTGNGAIGTAKITATSGNITASQNLTLSAGSGG